MLCLCNIIAYCGIYSESTGGSKSKDNNSIVSEKYMNKYQDTFAQEHSNFINSDEDATAFDTDIANHWYLL